MYTGHTDAQWQPFFQAIQSKLTDQAFETWFRPLRFQRSANDGVLSIAAPNSVVRDWILSKYAEPLRQSLDESQLGALRIEWRTNSNTPFAADSATQPSSEPESVTPLGSVASVSHEALFSDVARLNADYAFADFVVASCNRLGHAAAM